MCPNSVARQSRAELLFLLSYPPMETLITEHFPPLSTPLTPQSRSPLSFRSIPIRNPSLLCSSLRKCQWNPKQFAVLCSISASPDPNPCNFGGWDELDLLDGSNIPGEPDPLRRFLVSVGIHDRKHAFMFFLGFVSALAVSRLRFSSMAVLPVSVLVFVAGFSAGLAQAGLVNQIGRKYGEFRGFDEKLSDLGAFFSELDVKMSDLKSAMEGAIDSNRVEMGSIDTYLEIVEYARSTIASTRKSMEGSADREGGKKSNQKPGGRKRREAGIDGFDFLKFVGGLFEEHLIGLGSTKVKDTDKGELGEQLNLMAGESPVSVGPLKGNVAGNEVEGRGSKPLLHNDIEASKVERSDAMLGAVEGDTEEEAMTANTMAEKNIPVKNTASVLNGEKYADYMLSYDDDLNNLSKSLHFSTKRGSYEKLVFKHIYEGQTSQDFRDSYNRDRRTAERMDFFASESNASSLSERTFEIHDGSYFASHGRKSINSKIERMHGIGSKQTTVKSEDQSVLDNQEPLRGAENGNIPSSSTTSTDEEFNQNMKEATDLLKRARECMVSQADEETADKTLYKSARLLSTAVALKPMSLLAVGQLGNTYLLHGELKLKISRELRTLLSRSDALSNGKVHGVQFKKLDSRVLRKEDVASVLVDVCEECEGLFVEAGRTYRKALSIDGNDIRALYNWGLALSFRAQLIGDIGPEAAFDADKVYLAAIDKFNSMMSRSNAYAPDALYRWGMALQQRSHLRPRNSRDKIKLLQQAKCLFEDVLCVESDNPQVREALSSCVSELNYNGQW